MTRRIEPIDSRTPGRTPPRRRRDWDAAVGWALMVLTVALVVAVFTGCTRAELAAWVVWYQTDPAAAVDHANTPAVQQRLEAASATPAPAPSGRGGVWDRIAACESGGRWDYPPVTNSSGTYSGGLMIGHRWWPLYGGREFAAYPYQASRTAQITVAERIADDVGLDAGWQCWP